MQILVGRANSGTFLDTAIDSMHELRYHVFRERLQWDIPVISQRERDGYDDCNPVFVLAHQEHKVMGCCRLLPTTGTYMLKDTFPQLLGTEKAPEAADIWEISRFAIAKEARSGFGFSSLPVSIIRKLVQHANVHNIRSYVFVTTTGFERLLNQMGVHIERFAEPQQIGIEKSVALWMHNDMKTLRACGTKSSNDLIKTIHESALELA